MYKELEGLTVRDAQGVYHSVLHNKTLLPFMHVLCHHLLDQSKTTRRAADDDHLSKVCLLIQFSTDDERSVAVRRRKFLQLTECGGHNDFDLTYSKKMTMMRKT